MSGVIPPYGIYTVTFSMSAGLNYNSIHRAWIQPHHVVEGVRAVPVLVSNLKLDDGNISPDFFKKILYGTYACHILCVVKG
jgi:hypothetical protein